VPPVIYKDHRGNRLPSVTTIIGRFKESGGLLYWANQQGLEGKTLDQARAEVTTPGTLAHKAVEDHINGRPETALTGAGEVTEKARNAYAAGCQPRQVTSPGANAKKPTRSVESKAERVAAAKTLRKADAPSICGWPIVDRCSFPDGGLITTIAAFNALA
jgi:hypothetical protein